MRWRIMSLQAVLIVVLGAAAVFLINEGNFVNTTVHDQLAAQQIFFPPASAVVAGGALDPAEFSDITQYAGLPVDSGVTAKAYADGFIGRHLKTIAGGKTYAQVSRAAQQDPTNAKLAGQQATLFQGNTLRNMLLNAWGWSTLATYTTYGGDGLVLAALVVLVALGFEILAWRREAAVATKVKTAGKLVPAL
jgi:hypothetical protein